MNVRALSICIGIIAALSFAGLAALAERCAWAATPSEIEAARKLFEEAERAEGEGRWAEALRKLESVVQIKETAGVRFHIATCRDNLGMVVAALESFERAKQLALESGATDVLDLVGPAIARLRAQAASVTVVAPKGVEHLVVFVDHVAHAGVPSGEKLLVDPGTHHVIVKVGDETVLDRFVTLAKGGSTTLRLRDPSAKQPTTTPAQPHADTAGQSTRATQHSVTGSSSPPVAAWAALGAGAALGIAGYLAYHKADILAANSSRVCARSLSCDPARADEVRRWDAITLGLWVGAAVGVGTGVALAMSRSDDTGTSTALLLEPARVNLLTTF